MSGRESAYRHDLREAELTGLRGRDERPGIRVAAGQRRGMSQYMRWSWTVFCLMAALSALYLSSVVRHGGEYPYEYMPETDAVIESEGSAETPAGYTDMGPKFGIHRNERKADYFEIWLVPNPSAAGALGAFYWRFEDCRRDLPKYNQRFQTELGCWRVMILPVSELETHDAI